MLQAQPPSVDSLGSEDAWYNEELEQQSAGKPSTSGRVEDEVQYVELPTPQNVRCLCHVEDKKLWQFRVCEEPESGSNR